MKNFSLPVFPAVFSFLICPFFLSSQNNLIEWQKTFGGSSYDGAYQIKQTSDNGYIVCGYSWSNDGDIKGHHGSNGWYPDGYVMRLNANGDTLWTRSLGGTYDDYASSIIETDDGNFVVALHSESTDGDITANKGGWDYWIVKLSPAGSLIWQKSYGGTGSDYATSVVQAPDGNYVVAGYSGSTNGDITGNKGYDDFWIIKISENDGTILWKKNYGGTNDDNAFSVSNTSDNGFIVAGYTWSNDIDVTINQGYEDFWVIKLDSAGNLQWQKSMGGDYYDEANFVIQTSDNGFILAGTTYSASGTGDVSVHLGGWDYWVVKLNSSGTQIEWEKTYGGTMNDLAWAIVQTADNGYMLSGFSESNDVDVSANHGNKDYWTAKLDNAGSIQWSSTFGGDSLDYCLGMIQTNDGGFALAGLTRSFNEDVTLNKGEADIWLIKTYCNPPITPEICLVTVDSTSTKNLVVWEKPVSSNIDSFRVYRDVVGNYTYLGSVGYNELSKFTDNTLGVNPQITSYKYKISSVDTCGHESPLGVFHKTIHLQTNGTNLTWDNYSGFNSSFFYRILRDTTGTGNLIVVDSVTNSNFTWTDLNPPVVSSAAYVIEVVHPTGGCTVTKAVENHNSSRSNRGNSAPPGSLPVADFSADNLNISPGGSVNFSDQTTNNPISWFWTFTGGSPSSSTQQNPQNIVYSTVGCYNVTLVAVNSNGSDTIIKSCYINVSTGGAPVADFTATSTIIGQGDSVSFFDLSLNNPTQWQWIFTNGNPSVSTLQNPQNIKYNNLGCFDVTLISSNGNGSNSKVKTCYIYVNPLGVDGSNVENSVIQISPNPNDGKFQVSGSGFHAKKLEIINVLGGKVFEKTISPKLETWNVQLEISIPKGIYFLKVDGENGQVWMQKVVLN